MNQVASKHGEAARDGKYEDNALLLNKGFLVDIMGYFKLVLSSTASSISSICYWVLYCIANIERTNIYDKCVFKFCQNRTNKVEINTNFINLLHISFLVAFLIIWFLKYKHFVVSLETTPEVYRCPLD